MIDTFCEAETLRGKSRYKEAIILYRKALKAYRGSGNSAGILDCLLSMGDTYRMIGDFRRAADSYTRASALSAQMRRHLMRADAMTGKALSVRALGEWENALRLFSKAGSVYKEKSDLFGVAFTLWAEGGAFRVGGDITSALRSFKAAKKIYEKLAKGRGVAGDEHTASETEDVRRGIGYCMCGLGGVSRVAGLFGDSLEYYMSANKLFKGLNDRFGTAYSHCGIGNAFRMKGSYEKAMEHLKRAETIYGRIGDIVSYSYTIWSMGMIHLMKRRLSAAEACYDKALANFRKTKDVRGIIYCKLGRGELRILNGDSGAARRLFQTALKESLNRRFAVEACHARALLAFLDGRGTGDPCYRGIGAKLRFGSFPFNIP